MDRPFLSPGLGRNSLEGPGYKDVDVALLKNFGLPKAPVLGETSLGRAQ
jgi:hypothetical protein